MMAAKSVTTKPRPRNLHVEGMIPVAEQAGAMLGLLTLKHGKPTPQTKHAAMPEKPADPRRTKRFVEIGRRIAEARALKGYTQERLATLIGVTTSAVGQWESGFTMCSTENYAQLAKHLDVSREWLETGDEAENVNRAKTPMEREVLQLLRQLEFRDQMEIFQVVDRKVKAVTRSKGTETEQ